MNELKDFEYIKRYPHNDNLKAWDAADELLMEELSAIPELQAKRILILNDSFGALAISLQNYKSKSYTDSYVSSKGMRIIDKKGIEKVLSEIRSRGVKL